MSHSAKLVEHLKVGFTTVAVAALIVVTLPLVAIALFLARFVLLAALAVAVPAFAFSPALRNWLMRETEATYKGLRVPTDVWVHPRHAWARAKSVDDVTVGVDDLVSRVLGPLDEVRLPALGQALVEGQDMLWLRRGSRTLAVKAPVSGTVVSANDQATADPTVIQQSPYEAGWVLKLRPTMPPVSWKNLRRDGAAKQWFRDEVDRLLAAISAQPAAVPVLQDGGSLSEQLHDELDDPTWQKVRSEFFGAAL